MIEDIFTVLAGLFGLAYILYFIWLTWIIPSPSDDITIKKGNKDYI